MQPCRTAGARQRAGHSVDRPRWPAGRSAEGDSSRANCLPAAPLLVCLGKRPRSPPSLKGPPCVSPTSAPGASCDYRALHRAAEQFQADAYTLGPDSLEHEGVPKGKVTQATWKSDIFPGTVRDYWVYVPAQYDAKKPACVMVFQDGGGYQDLKGRFRVPTVFDNLIHKKEMPVTIGIFINPGKFPFSGPQGEAASQPQLRVRHAVAISMSASW